MARTYQHTIALERGALSWTLVELFIELSAEHLAGEVLHVRISDEDGSRVEGSSIQEAKAEFPNLLATEEVRVLMSGRDARATLNTESYWRDGEVRILFESSNPVLPPGLAAAFERELARRHRDASPLTLEAPAPAVAPSLSADDDEAQPLSQSPGPVTPWERLVAFVSHPGWQGIAAMVGIGVVVVALIAALIRVVV